MHNKERKYTDASQHIRTMPPPMYYTADFKLQVCRTKRPIWSISITNQQ